VRPEIEKQRQQAEQEAQSSIDKDAISAIEETNNAINAIAGNKPDDALAAIERATGKINILLARNPSTALIPVDAQVNIIDTAPPDRATILDLAKDASVAVDKKDFPDARVILHALMSEIRVRTYNIPLATYPDALKEAARLLDQKKTQEASAVLLTALNTLVIADHVTPIPILVARTAIEQAEAQRDKDKNAAHTALEAARLELQRAKDLGYAATDPQYAALNDAISNLQKQLKGTGDTSSLFGSLKERLNSFLSKISKKSQNPPSTKH
jgi:hypothetical protein